MTVHKSSEGQGDWKSLWPNCRLQQWQKFNSRIPTKQKQDWSETLFPSLKLSYDDIQEKTLEIVVT